ncbi:TTK protein kinase [Edhazardia aedis USNM 41457]|uniref:TTK protein kinase n=1 Tax=Edhazardia aedis (strain USNM 41457) TaxID=1003232 RepID=J9DD00_EDHAE|nr:TTK protein kinase [Edhazardia aedis USNM 41457]|eukprot:EJW05349.1 TTK protein kinase [Edhazardia aedis USNM 41457]
MEGKYTPDDIILHIQKEIDKGIPYTFQLSLFNEAVAVLNSPDFISLQVYLNYVECLKNCETDYSTILKTYKLRCYLFYEFLVFWENYFYDSLLLFKNCECKCNDKFAKSFDFYRFVNANLCADKISSYKESVKKETILNKNFSKNIFPVLKLCCTCKLEHLSDLINKNYREIECKPKKDQILIFFDEVKREVSKVLKFIDENQTLKTFSLKNHRNSIKSYNNSDSYISLCSNNSYKKSCTKKNSFADIESEKKLSKSFESNCSSHVKSYTDSYVNNSSNNSNPIELIANLSITNKNEVKSLVFNTKSSRTPLTLKISKIKDEKNCFSDFVDSVQIENRSFEIVSTDRKEKINKNKDKDICNSKDQNIFFENKNSNDKNFLISNSNLTNKDYFCENNTKFVQHCAAPKNFKNNCDYLKTKKDTFCNNFYESTKKLVKNCTKNELSEENQTDKNLSSKKCYSNIENTFLPEKNKLKTSKNVLNPEKEQFKSISEKNKTRNNMKNSENTYNNSQKKYSTNINAKNDKDVYNFNNMSDKVKGNIKRTYERSTKTLDKAYQKFSPLNTIKKVALTRDPPCIKKLDLINSVNNTKILETSKHNEEKKINTHTDKSKSNIKDNEVGILLKNQKTNDIDLPKKHLKDYEVLSYQAEKENNNLFILKDNLKIDKAIYSSNNKIYSVQPEIKNQEKNQKIQNIQQRNDLTPISEIKKPHSYKIAYKIDPTEYRTNITSQINKIANKNKVQINQEENKRSAPFNHNHGSHSKEQSVVNISNTSLTNIAQNYQTIQINNKQLTKIKLIGKGGCGKVYLVLYNDDLYALKEIKICGENETVIADYKNEIDFLEKLKGDEHIVNMIDFEEKDECIYILMEYGDCDLAKVIRQYVQDYKRKRSNYKDAKFINNNNMNIDNSSLHFNQNLHFNINNHNNDEMKNAPFFISDNMPFSTVVPINMIKSLWEQMLNIVQKIHNLKIVHRDLKPANFLLVKGKLKLIDFGIAKAIKGDTTNINTQSQVGTINYMAPEALECDKKMGRSADVWSLGCILYEMCFGKVPLSKFDNLLKKIKVLQDKNYQIEYIFDLSNLLNTKNDDFVKSSSKTGENAFVNLIDLDLSKIDSTLLDNVKCLLTILKTLKSCLQRDPKKRKTIEQLLNDKFISNTYAVNKKELTMLIKKIWKLRCKGNIDELSEKIFTQFIQEINK